MSKYFLTAKRCQRSKCTRTGCKIIDHFQQIPLALIMCSALLGIAFLLSIRMKAHAVDLDVTE